MFINTFMNQKFSLRKIGPKEAPQFFQLRLLALKTDPNAFVAILEEEEQLSPADVENYLRKNYVIGAFTQNNQLLGTLVYMEQERQKFKHIGILGGMYVHPEFRGCGIGKKLLASMLQNLQKIGHLYSLQLKVVTDNLPAIRLYESAGFSIWATEKNALLHGGNFFDQHHMALQFFP